MDNDGNGFVDDWRGWNFLDNNNNTDDLYGTQNLHGHGTRVAGIIAAKLNNAIGVASVAGGVKIMPIKLSDHTDEGFSFASVDDAITICRPKMMCSPSAFR